MKYTLAFAAALAGVSAATMRPVYGAPVSEFTDGQPQATQPASSAPAAITTPAPEAPKTSTAFVTDVETIFSCGPEITSCPYRSTTPVASVPATSAPATSQPAVSTPVVSSPSTAAPPKSTTPVATSAPATSKPATSAPATSAPATTAPATSLPATSAPATSAAPPAPPVPVLSTQAIETCVPTTIYKTITITSSSSALTTPVATSKAISTAPYYGTGGSAKPTGGVASGTGVGPKPSSTAPIAQGAASGLTVSFSGLALAAAAALLF